MDMKDNRNLIISILLNLVSVFLAATIFLGYKLLEASCINNDLNRENISVLRECKELNEKLEKKEKQESI